MAADWILFALGVVLIGAVGIGIGLLVAGPLSAWGDRHGDGEGDTFVTEVGPPEADDGAPDAGAPGEEGADD
jgi:hypothetical protein